MAFIVEMIRGRHNRVEINNMGKLILSDTKDLDFEIYRCAGTIWEDALFIGENLGWKPMGSVLSNTVGTIEPIIEDYTPSSWNNEQIYKVFLADDALEFSNALQMFIEIYMQKGHNSIPESLGNLILSNNELKQKLRWVTIPFLEEFIGFLRKGEFIFVWDD